MAKSLAQGSVGRPAGATRDYGIMAARSRRLHLLAALAVGLLLAGCAADEANREEAIAARAALVGLSKADLLQCAGPPDKSAQSGDLEVYSYQAERLVRGNSGARSGFSFGSSGSAIFIPFGHQPDTTTVTSCRVRFTLRNDAVETVSYVQGTYGAARLSDCATLVRPCLRLTGYDREANDTWQAEGDGFGAEDDWQDGFGAEPPQRDDWESDW